MENTKAYIYLCGCFVKVLIFNLSITFDSFVFWRENIQFGDVYIGLHELYRPSKIS